MRVNSCIPALRLRTIPLSISGVSLGAMLAAADYHVDWRVVVFLLLTAASLQILAELKSKLMIVITALCGMTTLFFSFGTLFCMESLLLMVLGYFAVNMALKNKEKMDFRLRMIINFVSYGLAGVFGTYCLCTHEFAPSILFLPSISVGSLSMAVFHLEKEGDVRLGQLVMVLMGWAAMLAYAFMRIFDPWHFLFVIILPLYVWYLVEVWKNYERDLDCAQFLLVGLIFVLSIIFGTGLLVYLI